ELTLTLDFNQVMSVIHDEVARATGADGCTLALVKPRDQWRQTALPEIQQRMGDGPAVLADIEREAVLRGGDPVVVQDYTGSQFRPAPDNMRSALAAAFVYEDEVVGVMHLHHRQPNHFDERAAEFLRTLATKAALGYGNAV